MDQYIEKLEWLKEFMALKIDGNLPFLGDRGVFIDMTCIPPMPIDKIMSIFNQTGILFHRNNDYQKENVHIPSFDEWYALKTN